MITGKTSVLALLGNPVAHSLSPQMHAGWIADHGLDAAYVALPISHDGPQATIDALKRVALKGVNITVPFKEAAARAADFRDPLVEKLSAANVLAWREDGVHAFNTDARGFVASLAEAYPDWRAKSRTALVLGAGGAARGIAFGLAEAGVRSLLFANRTRLNAEEMAAALATDCASTEVFDWAHLAAAFAKADLIVNATSLGMKGQPSQDWPIHAAQQNAIVCDAVYAPLETDLLRAARGRGLASLDGLGMLIHQGALAFEIWFGIRPDAAAARRRLMAILESRA
jgi:shikimate dehydrogenase